MESKAKKSKQYAYPAKDAGKDIIFCEMKRECVCANGGVIVRVIMIIHYISIFIAPKVGLRALSPYFMALTRGRKLTGQA